MGQGRAFPARRAPFETARLIAMTKMPAVVFLFDVDNTLLDNDAVQADLKRHLEHAYGVEARDRYWKFLNNCGANWVTSITSAPWSVFV